MLNDTIETSSDALITARWEPCAAFAAGHSGSSICTDCGWLDDEHGTDAVVHHLPLRITPSRGRRRLAS